MLLNVILTGLVVLTTKALAQRNCSSLEICVSDELCIKSNDSGKNLINIRIDRSCGEHLVCCERAQIDKYLKLFSETLNVRPNSSTGSTTPKFGTEKRNSLPTETVAPTNAYKSCGNNKECVPRVLCNGTINDSGRFLIKPRVDDLSNSGCNTLEECCPINSKLEELPFLVDDPRFSASKTACGYSNERGLLFELEGYNNNEAQFGEFPWMVAIQGGRNLYICGGSIIAESVVVTAAHCVYTHDANQLLARAGEWDTRTESEPYKHQNRRVREVIIHEQFDNETLFNDIALLILTEPFNMTLPHIQPICLPHADANFANAICYASGWGKENFNNATQYQSILKKIDLPFVPKEECETKLRKTILGRYFWLRPSLSCAGGVAGKDVCTGDGGSPLVCPYLGESGRYSLAGIVAFGIQCGVENVPGVYANVPFLRPWIDKKLKERDIIVDDPVVNPF